MVNEIFEWTTKISLWTIFKIHNLDTYQDLWKFWSKTTLMKSMTTLLIVDDECTSR